MDDARRRLDNIVRGALLRHPRDTAAQEAAIMDAIKDDADLLFEFQRPATDALLAILEQRIRASG